MIETEHLSWPSVCVLFVHIKDCCFKAPQMSPSTWKNVHGKYKSLRVKVWFLVTCFEIVTGIYSSNLPMSLSLFSLSPLLKVTPPRWHTHTHTIFFFLFPISPLRSPFSPSFTFFQWTLSSQCHFTATGTYVNDTPFWFLNNSIMVSMETPQWSEHENWYYKLVTFLHFCF